jgi:ribonuclease P protein component
MLPSALHNYRLARSQRLKSSRLIRETLEHGRRFAGKIMILWVRTGDDASLRLAVLVGRKIGGAAVRNRAKRRLREAFRLNRCRMKGNGDIVLMARDSIRTASWDEVQSELISLADKAGILEEEESVASSQKSE